MLFAGRGEDADVGADLVVVSCLGELVLGWGVCDFCLAEAVGLDLDLGAGVVAAGLDSDLFWVFKNSVIRSISSSV